MERKKVEVKSKKIGVEANEIKAAEWLGIMGAMKGGAETPDKCVFLLPPANQPFLI